jgi:hypothetical protein
MKRLLSILALTIFLSTNAYAQFTADYGLVVTSLTTASTGAVTGTAFAIPTTYAAMITWTVVADGSALSTILEGSVDNSTWFTIDTQATATGGIKTFGFTAVKFARCSQVSRTGGTATSCTLATSRGYSQAAGGSFIFTGQTLFADGNAAAPSVSFTSNPNSGIYNIGGAPTVAVLGTARAIFASNTLGFQVISAYPIGWSADATVGGGASDTSLNRVAAGQISAGTSTTKPVIDGTLFTSSTQICTAADLVATTGFTFTLPAGSLNTNGRGIHIDAVFVTGATANTKTIAVNFGASNVGGRTTATDNNQVIRVEVDVMRASATTQVAISKTGVSTLNATTTLASLGQFLAPAETLANAIVVNAIMTNSTAAASDICFKYARISTIW